MYIFYSHDCLALAACANFNGSIEKEKKSQSPKSNQINRCRLFAPLRRYTAVDEELCPCGWEGTARTVDCTNLNLPPKHAGLGPSFSRNAPGI